MKFEFSRQIFEEVSNIKFHQNPSSGSRVVPSGQTDMTKLIVAFAVLRARLQTADLLHIGGNPWRHFTPLCIVCNLCSHAVSETCRFEGLRSPRGKLLCTL
jgi:hypothetical protein